jgi:UDP-N-acetylglucosamine 4-epimerase
MKSYAEVENGLSAKAEIWLVTGCAGFIGSHLIERLLNLNQKVVGVDNFATGFQANIDKVLASIGSQKAKNFTFHEIDICQLDKFSAVVADVDYILHQAAIGSVPRSIADPIYSHQSNVDGFCNLLVSAKENKKIKKIVYASSSSVYGSDSADEKREDQTGDLLSPYALTKKTNEMYADVFTRTYKFKAVGLRYFNVFGPRQNPEGAYAAVIPKWIEAVNSNKGITIFGDGTTSRDFCFIENVVQANILAAASGQDFAHRVFNVALNRSTSLNELAQTIVKISGKSGNDVAIRYEDFRPGDIYKSCADITRIKETFGYAPVVFIEDGLKKTFESYTR